MKVILTQYVYKHGVAGDVVRVANGFARNYLIPRKLAVKATKKALEESQNLMAESAIRRNELNEQLIRVSRQIDGTELVFGRKAGSNGKLYGSVTTMDIAEALLEATGIDINRRRISERPLRELGTFEVPIRMGQDLSPIIKVSIMREEDLAAFLSEAEQMLDEGALESMDVSGQDAEIAMDDNDLNESAEETEE
ncbi:MAG TPA: 50S ribosomal protein L9, partial [Aggregatilineales bacterium]|nr:50S ribosomal protein L9 [Aggregatilineales bacterium]